MNIDAERRRIEKAVRERHADPEKRLADELRVQEAQTLHFEIQQLTNDLVKCSRNQDIDEIERVHSKLRSKIARLSCMAQLGPL